MGVDVVSFSERSLSVNRNTGIDVIESPECRIIEDEIHTRSLEWVKCLCVKEKWIHPCFGVHLTLYLKLFDDILDLSAYPKYPLGELTVLKDNGLGIEELDRRLNLPFQVIENAKDVFRGRLIVDAGMKRFNLSIKEFVEAFHELGLSWPYSSMTIFGGDTPLTKGYLQDLLDKKLKLKKTLKKLMRLALDLLPPARMHDTDTHFYISEEEMAKGTESIEDRIFKVIEHISSKQNQRIAKEYVLSKCFSNYFHFPASKVFLITFGLQERTWDKILVLETDPEKIPRQFTDADLEYPIYDSEGRKNQLIRPECSKTKTDPWACIFHIILKISWLANYIPGKEHPALNMGLFLKICIERTKGKMLLQNISGIAIELFTCIVSTSGRFRQEIDGKLKHLRISNETSIALTLNIMELLSNFMRQEPSYLQVCINLLPRIENTNEFHSRIVGLINKYSIQQYPNVIHDILDIVKGSIIVSYIFQRISKADPGMESHVRLTIIDGMPGLTYLINGIEGAHFAFKIEAEKIFGNIMKMLMIHAENKEFLSDLISLYLLCTEGLVSRALPPVNIEALLKVEFDAIGLSEDSFYPVILDLVNSKNVLCCDMAFHMLKLVRLWNPRQIKSIAIQSLQSSAQLYVGQRLRRERSSREANILAEISEIELRGIILPQQVKQKPPSKLSQSYIQILEKEVLQLKFEVNKDLFESILQCWNEIRTEKESFRWQKAIRLLILKLTHYQKPIKAIFKLNTRELFEKILNKILEHILETKDLSSAVSLFKWSLDQQIFLYDLASWIFVTGRLLSLCLENHQEILLEPVFRQFLDRTDKETFQYLLGIVSDRQETLKKNFPGLFFAPKSTIGSSFQSKIDIIIEAPKNRRTTDESTAVKNTSFDKKKDKEMVENLRLKDIVFEDSRKFQALLIKKLEVLHCRLFLKSKKNSEDSALEILSFTFKIQSLEDPIQIQEWISLQFSCWNDDLKTAFIKAVYDAFRWIKNPSNKKLAITELFILWKENTPLDLEGHPVEQLFQKLKEEQNRSRSLFERISNVTRLVLKKTPRISVLLFGSVILYGSVVLLKKCFSCEDEPSILEEIINYIAVNILQSVGKYCMTFNLPYGEGVLENCFDTEEELLFVENTVNSLPRTLEWKGKMYLISPSSTGVAFNHKLMEFII